MMKKDCNLESRSNSVFVLTGCDSGIGKSMAKILLDLGYTLVVSYLLENPFDKHDRVLALKTDLRIEEEVYAFHHFALKACEGGRKLEAIIANAGIALGGPIENLPLALFRECFEVNFFGAVSLIQAMIPSLIRDKGKIVVVGSMAGLIAMPFLSPYASTKFALEGFCDSLRREMAPFGVRVILFEPAAVATPIWNKAKIQDISFVDSKYMPSLHSFQSNFIEGGNRGICSDAAARDMVNKMLRKRPKARYIIASSVIVSKLMTLIPAIMLDRAVIRMFDMHYGQKEGRS